MADKKKSVNPNDKAARELSKRKVDHIRICTQEDGFEVETGSTWFHRIRLVARAFPKTGKQKLGLETKFLGKEVAAPLFISSMTGGSAQAYELNKIFARAAGKLGIAVGMGSIRIVLRKPEVLPDFKLKQFAPDVPVFANIGAAQLVELPHEQIWELAQKLECDAIAVHLNAGQELAQIGGDDNFAEWEAALLSFLATAPLPVMIKETGFGIDPASALICAKAGASAVDVAGSGGTNWMLVEQHRNETAGNRTFDTWGIPTAVATDAVAQVLRGANLDTEVFASGGIRDGLDIAKALALGASSVGIALPLLRAAQYGGQEAVEKVLKTLLDELSTAVVLSGARNVSELSRSSVFKDTEFRNYVSILMEKY